MAGPSRFLRGGARAVTGLVVVAVCVVAVGLLSGIPLPSAAREPIAITVDTEQNTDRSFVCPGSFAELGADSARPGAAIPVGTASVLASGTPGEATNLARAEGGEGLPAVFTAPSSEPFAAAQVQLVETETLRGTVASSCAVPLNEQWLLGGGSALGVSTTISLGNPGTVPATATLSVFDENGPVTDVENAGVLIAPGTEQAVSLNGYAPDRERLAVRVESTGAPITASLGVGHTTGIEPFAVSAVDRQAQPTSSLVIPGVANTSDAVAGPSDAGEGDEFPVIVRAMAPEAASGVARVTAVDGDGKRTELGEIELAASAIGELSVPVWPEGATSALIDADVPIVASVLGTVSEEGEQDYEWFAPAPVIEADQTSAAPVVRGGRLVIANPGSEEAVVTIASAGGEVKSREVTIPAGASEVVKAPADALLSSSAPVNAGVRILDGANLSGYPILPSDTRDGSLTVYPP